MRARMLEKRSQLRIAALLLAGGMASCVRFRQAPPREDVVVAETDPPDVPAISDALETGTDALLDVFDGEVAGDALVDADATNDVVVDTPVLDVVEDRVVLDAAPLVRITAPPKTCLTQNVPRTIQVRVEFAAPVRNVRVALEGVPADVPVSESPIVFSSSATTPMDFQIRLEGAPSMLGRRVTVQLSATPDTGVTVRAPLELQLENCPGVLDRTFNATGSTRGVFDLNMGGRSAGQAMRLSYDQSRQRMISSGVIHDGANWWEGQGADCALWAITNDGREQPAFGSNGLMVASMSPANYNETSLAMVNTNDGILVAALSGGPGVEGEPAAIFRATQLGRFDQTFGQMSGTTRTGFFYAGRFATPFSMRTEYLNAGVALPDGTTWLGGISRNGATRNHNTIAVRLAGDGSALPSPGGSYYVGYLFPNDVDFASAVLDGEYIVVAGQTGTNIEAVPETDIVVLRLRWSDNSLDTTFGNNGMARFNVGATIGVGSRDLAFDIAKAPDGNYLVAGVAGGVPVLLRVDRTGALLPFGATGAPVLQIQCSRTSRGFGELLGVAVGPSGDIAVSGYCRAAETGVSDFGDTLVALFRPDGSPVDNYGNSVTPGMFLSNLAGTVVNGSDFGNDIAIDERNRVLIAGTRRLGGSQYRPFVARLNAAE